MKHFSARTIAAAMLVTVAVIAGLSAWDATREANAALEELAQQQATVARAVAAQLEVWLAADNGGNPAEARLAALRDRLSQLERRNDLLILLRPPGERDFISTAGERVMMPVLADAFASPTPWLLLTRLEAQSLGLPKRMAAAGLARTFAGSDEAPAGGEPRRWGVAVVETAERHRDRESRSRWRLVLSVGFAAGLVCVFGVFSLRQQRRQLELGSALAIAELQQERDERLVRASRAATLGTLAMGIAHEISSPLGVISGRVEQLGKASDEKTRRSLKIIAEQTDHIHRVIRAFLNLARGAAPSQQRIDPADVARGAVALVEHVFAKAHVCLSTDVARELPALRGDRALLEQAVVNLLLNACHACGRGGHVELAVRPRSRMVEFVVTDDGAGISQAARDRITEPFFTTKPVGEGTGLGLAIVNEIVKNHFGRLTLEPHVPCGTRAGIEVPVVSDIAATPTPTEIRSEHGTG